MRRVLGPLVAFSLLALSGCVAYPYGSFYGYGSYGGYPYSGYPNGSPGYGAPYCPTLPSYGYPYDAYASAYGYGSYYGYGSSYGYGCSPEVVVPAPAPPQVVESPYPEPCPIDDPGEVEEVTENPWTRRHARRRYWQRCPEPSPAVDPDSPAPPASPAPGDPAVTPELQQPAEPDNVTQNSGKRRQILQEWQSRHLRRRLPQMNQPAPQAGPQTAASGPGPERAQMTQPNTQQRARVWQSGRQWRQFTRQRQQVGPRRPTMPRRAPRRSVAAPSQVQRPRVMPRQRRPVVSPRLRRAPSPSASSRRMLAGTPRPAPRLQAPRIRTTRPQARQPKARNLMPRMPKMH
ncbi:MAG: hypothetical protein JRI59_11025 [Deltaproteobacteria bacterium]|nr:hypothetical protein [Deltaproteobacteria bacterium]